MKKLPDPSHLHVEILKLECQLGESFTQRDTDELKARIVQLNNMIKRMQKGGNIRRMPRRFR